MSEQRLKNLPLLINTVVIVTGKILWLLMPPTLRYKRELCLYKHDGSCGECAKKCLNEALTENNLDKHKCYEMCLINSELILSAEET